MSHNLTKRKDRRDILTIAVNRPAANTNQSQAATDPLEGLKLWPVDTLKDVVGGFEVEVPELLDLFNYKYRQEMAVFNGAKPRYYPKNFTFSQVHKCIREQSYAIAKVEPDKSDKPPNEAGQMSMSLGIKVHDKAQAGLVEAGYASAEDMEIELDQTSETDKGGLPMAAYRLNGRPDGQVFLGLGEFSAMPPTIGAMLWQPLKDDEAFPIELKTWVLPKLHAERGNPYGNPDDRHKLREYYTQLQAALHFMSKPFGLIIAINTHHYAASIVAKQYEDNVIPFTSGDVQTWLVEYDPAFVQAEILDRAMVGVEALAKGELPVGEPERGNGFCGYVQQCEYATRKCGKKTVGKNYAKK